jgi:ribonucleoside-diphosphate reductase alpha chain
MAWKRGVKSLYYCRSLSIQRADNVSEKAIRPDEIVQRPVAAEIAPELPLSVAAKASTDYEECLACQ